MEIPTKSLAEIKFQSSTENTDDAKLQLEKFLELEVGVFSAAP